MPKGHPDKMMDKQGADSNLVDILVKGILELLGNLLVSKVMMQRLGQMEQQVASLWLISGKVFLPRTSLEFLPQMMLMLLPQHLLIKICSPVFNKIKYLCN
jgi:hypothetical protein